MRECCAKLGNAALWDKAFGNTTMCYENLIEYHKKYERYGMHRDTDIR